MTFTIAEDIKTLLTADYDTINSTTNLVDGDFELGDLSAGWTSATFSIDGAIKRNGSYSAKCTGAAQQITQTGLLIPVDLISSAKIYSYWNAGATNTTFNILVSYFDTGSEVVESIAFASAATWTEHDFLSSLTAGKVIISFQIINTAFDGQVNFDDIAFLGNSINIRLIDDDPPSSYPDTGEIVIGREQLPRLDKFNGYRSETFLVDLTVSYADASASSPDILKSILAEIDRVFDAESLTHDSYYYKIRYDWPGSYRIGVVKLQVEVLNALAVRPSLA